MHHTHAHAPVARALAVRARRATLATLAALAALNACSADGGAEASCAALETYTLKDEGTATAVGSARTVTIARGSAACAYDGPAQLALAVKGGGRVEDDAGVVTHVTVGESPVTLTWTLGPAPLRNELRIVGAEAEPLEVVATLDVPVVPVDFGDVHAWMADNGVTGTTEDVAIADDGSIAIGVDGGVLDMTVDADGKVSISKRALSGDPLPRAHGVAYDRAGFLWAADPKGKALHAISPTGVVKTHLTTNGSEPLDGPNDVAVGPGDRVVLSDPCRGELIAYDPATESVTDVHPFALKTEGGPNGFAFWGDELYVVTENTTLLCPNAKEKPLATLPLATLFRLDATDGKLGAHSVIEAGLGVFGDGMAFDAEGNLYVVVDTIKDAALDESRVMVLRKGESKLVPFVAYKGDRLLANVVFGRGPLGATTAYGVLIAIPPFTGADQRGLVRFEVGVPGLPLLP